MSFLNKLEINGKGFIVFYIGMQKFHALAFIFKNYCQTINLFKKLLCGLKKKNILEVSFKKLTAQKKSI